MNGIEATNIFACGSRVSHYRGELGRQKSGFSCGGADAFLMKPYRYDNLINLLKVKQ